MLIIKTALSVATFMLITNCAHHPDVRPSAKGIHKVILKIPERDTGYRNAMNQAKSYCKNEEGEKRPKVLKEITKYVGKIPEKQYLKQRKIGKILSGVGTGAAIFGNKSERKVGKGLMVGGGVTSSAAGVNYRYTLIFRCRR